MRAFWAMLDRLLWRVRRFFHPTVMQIAPGYEGYGGATITRRVDGAGAEWIACCARQQSDGYFGFFAFKNGQNVPLSPRVSGRGSIDDDGWWIAWEGSTKHQGPIPGFVPVPKGGDTSGLQAQIDALELQVTQLQQTIMALPPTTTNPVIRVPAAGGKEGGEIQLASGNASGVWVIDSYDGQLRFIHDNVLIDHWPK